MILIISNKELKLLTDALKAAVSDLTTSIDALIARQPAPTGLGSVADPDVQAAIDGITAQTARLATLVNPTPVQAASSGPTLVPSTDFANPIK